MPRGGKRPGAGRPTLAQQEERRRQALEAAKQLHPDPIGAVRRQLNRERYVPFSSRREGDTEPVPVPEPVRGSEPAPGEQGWAEAMVVKELRERYRGGPPCGCNLGVNCGAHSDLPVLRIARPGWDSQSPPVEGQRQVAWRPGMDSVMDNPFRSRGGAPSLGPRWEDPVRMGGDRESRSSWNPGDGWRYRQ